MRRTQPSTGSEAETLGVRISSWRELLERCGRKPTRKRVHALRVATLRIQAEVEDDLNDLPRASHEAQSMLRFGKLAHKLRDALGSVRELDVWIGKLLKLLESHHQTTGYVPRSTRETSRQIERLEQRLTKKRERAGAKLVAEIEKRRDDLLLVSRHVEKAAGERGHEAHGEQAFKLLKEFAGIVAEYPVFDEGNLHEFRKKIKNIRYVAEIHGANPECGLIAAQMKKAQTAIGEWHDWQVLAQTATRGKHVKSAEAGELLSSIASEAYEKAVARCHVVVRRMADLERDNDVGLETVGKAPVRSEKAASLSDLKLA